jgi:hypothetical protein
MAEKKKTVVMKKGDLYADIFDSPETIAQARRDGYSLVDPADIKKTDINDLSKNELIELAKEKGVYEKGMERLKREEVREKVQAAKEPDAPSREELVQAAIAKGFDAAGLNSLADGEIAALLGQQE